MTTDQIEKQREKWRAASAEYRRRYPARPRAYSVVYRTTHKEQIRVYDAAHRLRALSATKARQAAWYAANSERIRAKSAAWIAAHPERVRSRNATRRALKAGATGSHTQQEWIEKCALLGNVCIYCGEAKPLARDHKVPLSRGGADDIANILPACKSCNSKKSARTALEYIALKSGREVVS